MDLQADLAAHDAKFLAWQARNPGKPFSAFSASAIANGIKKGRPHATLGPALHSADEWRQNGLPTFKSIQECAEVPVDAKICDYGCGSLRVGVHFIERQVAGAYYGIDVTDDFIAHGLELAGSELITRKQAHTGTIEAMLAEVIAADIDLLFNVNVASHVHPDEFETFIAHMLAICHKPGSAAVIHTMNAPELVRFQRSGWARPVEAYIAAMSPMRLERSQPIGPCERNGIDLETHMLTFRRD